MTLVIELTIPILSIPWILMQARKERILWLVHFVETIRLPWLDISLVAVGQLDECIMIVSLGLLYPTISSPGIGLQHFAIL